MSNPVKSTKTLCAVPWMHLAFEPSGKVVPCCLTSNHDYWAGDLNTQSIEQIWNSDNMKKLRVEMMNGEEPAICDKCFDKEKITYGSGRQHHNRIFGSVLEQIPIITEADGTCNKMELKYWDFRFSNLCNLKCRTCGPRYSSAWVPDGKKLGYNADQEKVWNIESVDDMSNFDFLKEQVKHVEKIYFAGGEPLLMPEHWQMLDMLVENKRFDVSLSYNTNCTTLTYGKKNIIDYWKQWDFGKLEVWPSLDEIDERAELVRSGTKWKDVEANLKQLIELPNAIIRPGLTIGGLNVFRLPAIIDRLMDLGVLKEKFGYINFFLNLVMDPKFYHVKILPDEYKTKISADLLKYCDDFNKKYNTNINIHFDHILHELSLPHDPNAAKTFLGLSARLDDIRNEKTFEVIPELDVVRQMYPEYYKYEKNN
jgi:radical SAM protein with 4Fe4S-binding SPASM domain